MITGEQQLYEFYWQTTWVKMDQIYMEILTNIELSSFLTYVLLVHILTISEAFAKLKDYNMCNILF